MILWILALILLLDSFHSTAAWNENSPLILIDIPSLPFTTSNKQFPWIVRESKRYQCIVYYTDVNEDPLITYAYCPAPRASNAFCNYAPSFAGGNYQKGLRPRSECQSPVLYDMVEVTHKRHGPETCRYNRQTGHWFKFVYWRCRKKGKKMKNTVIYNACYDETNKQIILGAYTIATPSLLANPLLQDQQAHTFKFDFYDYYEDFNDQFQRIAHHLYEAENNKKYVRRMVLPPELLPFALQRKPLFHYMNIAPMNVNLLAGWERLMSNLKNRISKFKEAIHVTAGLLDTLMKEQPDEDGQPRAEYLGYIGESGEIAIPYIWWLLLYNDSNRNGVVIMMHNKPYITGRGNPNMAFYHPTQCSLLVCGLSNIRDWLPSENTFPQNFIYCCYPHVITTKFSLNGSNDLLVFPNEIAVKNR